MHINASFLHNRYSAQVRQGSQTSLLDGSRGEGVRATRPRLSAPSVISDKGQFASIVAQKTVKPQPAAQTEQGESAQDKPADSSGLAKSLENAANFIESEFGKEASTAFMGIVLKHSGDEVTEESLGGALLQSVKFMDRNFGFASGDKLMSHFNSDINESMNDYFENGLQEHFFAVNPHQSLDVTLQNTFHKVSQDYGQETADSIKSMIEQVLGEEGKSLDSLKKGLEKGLEEAESTTPGITAEIQSIAAGELLDKISPQGPAAQTATAPDTGTLLDAVA